MNNDVLSFFILFSGHNFHKYLYFLDRKSAICNLSKLIINNLGNFLKPEKMKNFSSIDTVPIIIVTFTAFSSPRQHFSFEEKPF